MITEQDKLLALLKHQPEMTMYDANEYAELYEYEYMYNDHRGIFNKDTKELMSFLDFVDLCVKQADNDDDEWWHDEEDDYVQFQQKQEEPLDYYDGT